MDFWLLWENQATVPCILAFLELRRASPSSQATLSASSASYPLTHVSVTSIQAQPDIGWVFIHYFPSYGRTPPHLPITPKEAPLSSRDHHVAGDVLLGNPWIRGHLFLWLSVRKLFA